MDIVVATAEKTEKMTLFSLSNINCNNNDACFLMMVDFLKLFKFEATNVCRNSYFFFFFFFYNSIPLSELAASQTAVPAAPASLSTFKLLAFFQLNCMALNATSQLLLLDLSAGFWHIS